MSASDEQQQALEQLRMDPDGLYREEVFTDRRIGTIQRLTPVTRDGSDDSSREVLYLGQTQVMTPVGALPLNFELEASNLEEAMAQFPAAAAESLERTMEELKEMQREQASRIMTPDQLGGQGGYGGGGMPGGGGGGVPGGGIQIR
ncbi:hypothetical protein [Sediminicurvatus halobius]|uniref:Cytoplasmic protein n=1 Tax=Sediminicurvatus halobius TaxID=2182432 RepID=A0A2U2N6Z8_9GAMM|nr:hypothetical protein [Spiribacter halobius]PWG64853.1 hypothetical protein DEM34_03395 [Spiribacter halobius]UEX78293.1 hypothetical protein LMH63_01215 [Spiribacter halobius]